MQDGCGCRHIPAQPSAVGAAPASSLAGGHATAGSLPAAAGSCCAWLRQAAGWPANHGPPAQPPKVPALPILLFVSLGCQLQVATAIKDAADMHDVHQWLRDSCTISVYLDFPHILLKDVWAVQAASFQHRSTCTAAAASCSISSGFHAEQRGMEPIHCTSCFHSQIYIQADFCGLALKNTCLHMLTFWCHTARHSSRSLGPTDEMHGLAFGKHMLLQEQQAQPQQQQQQQRVRRVREDENSVVVRGTRYTKLECVGRGGSSKVYKVRILEGSHFQLRAVLFMGILDTNTAIYTDSRL